MGNQNLILLPEAARTANGQGSSMNVSQMSELAVFVVVSAAAGTSPSLTAVLQDSPDGDNWADAFTFPAATAAPTVLRAGWQDLKMSVGRFVRLRWTITGTSPSFTFWASVVPISSN